MIDTILLAVIAGIMVLNYLERNEFLSKWTRRARKRVAHWLTNRSRQRKQ